MNELFQPRYETKLNEVGERVFRKLKKLKSHVGLQQARYWFKNDKFKLNNNFLITKKGIKFFFNSYEIGPYYFGTTEILIDYQSIKDLIKPGSFLTRFAG